MKIEFKHQTSQEGVGFKHRIVAVETDVAGARRERYGQWSSYTGVARMTYHGQSLMAVTDYYDGTFPVGVVVELVTPRHAARFNRTAGDAHTRVHDMSVGCLVDASDEFLLAMQSKLSLLIDRIGTELRRRIKAELDEAPERGSDR
jgi:hypothetical protein